MNVMNSTCRAGRESAKWSRKLTQRIDKKMTVKPKKDISYDNTGTSVGPKIEGGWDTMQIIDKWPEELHREYPRTHFLPI